MKEKTPETSAYILYKNNAKRIVSEIKSILKTKIQAKLSKID